jgi:hypothetical protein
MIDAPASLSDSSAVTDLIDTTEQSLRDIERIKRLCAKQAPFRRQEWIEQVRLFEAAAKITTAQSLWGRVLGWMR